MTDIAQLGLEVRSDGVVTASKRLRDLQRQAGKTTRASDQLIQKAKRLSQEMSRVGRSLSTSVTLPLAAAAGGAIKLATDFDSALTQINTLVGVSRDEVAGFRQEILNLSSGVGRGPTELARGLFAVTSAGLRGTAALQTLEAASKASAVGLGATRDVALASVAAVTAYGESNLSAAESVEILVGTVEQGNLAAEELSGVIGRVIGIAAELGVAFEDVGAFIASFSRLGVSAAESTTALRGILNSILKPTDDTKKAFESLNMSVSGFQDQIQEQGFTVAMQNLVNRSREMDVSMSRLFPSVEGLAGVLGVFGGEAGKAEEVLDGVSAAVGTLDERFQAVIDQDPAMAFNMMRAEIESLAIEISANLMPAWLDMLGGVRDAAVAFRDLDEATQSNIVKFGALAAAIGPVLIVLGSIINAVSRIAPVFRSASAGYAGLALAAGGLALQIGKALQEFLEFDEFLSQHADRLNTEVTPATERFSDAHIEMLNATQNMPEAPDDLADQIEKTETQLRRLTRQYGENSVAARSAEDRLESLQARYQALTGSAEESEEATNDLADSMSFLEAMGLNVATSSETISAALKAQEEAMKSAKEEADAFLEMIGDMQAELDGPSAVAVREFTEQMERLANLEGLSPEQVTQSVQTLVANLNDQIGGDEIEDGFFEAAFGGISRGIENAFDAMTGSDLAQMSFGDVGRAVGRSVFSEVGASLGEEFLSEPLEGIGQSIGESVGESLGEGLGEKFGESMSKALGEIAGPLGQLAGELLFDRIFPQKEPKFQVGGATGFGQTGAGRIGFDLSPATEFGDLFIRTRKMEASAQDALRNALISFDQTIADIITDEGQMNRMRDALNRWGFDTQDEGMSIQRVLESRFKAIVGTFDQFGQDIIMSGANLEAQIQNMLDLILVRAQMQIGDTLGRDIGQDTQIFLAKELARAGETLSQSFQRLSTITSSLNTAMDLTGGSISSSQVEVVKFGDALQRAFGDDLERLTGGLQTIFDTFFSEEERLTQQIEANRSSAGNLLEQLGLNVTEDMLTKEGFRTIFDQLMGTLDPDDTAILIEAGVAISSLIDAEESLAEARDNSTEQARSAAEIARERESLELRELQLMGETAQLRQIELENLDASNRAILERIFLLEDEAEESRKQEELARTMKEVSQEMLELISPTRAEFARLTSGFQEQISAAQELGASEEQLGQIRSLQLMQVKRFTADLQISILRLKEDLFGTNDQFEQVGDTISNVADRINRSIVRALESVDDWLASSNISSVSPLTPQQRLETAESGFRSAFESAMAGDLESLESLPELADAFIGEAADFFGTSNQEFVSLFNSVRRMMGQASNLEPDEIRPPTADQVDDVITGVGNVNSSVNETTSEIANLERELQAFELSDEIGTLAAITGRQPAEIARELGFSGQNMREILQLLGVDIPELTGAALDGKFNDVVGAIGATNFLLNTVDSSLQALSTLNTIAQLTGQTPSAIADSLGFSSESMLQVLRTLGIDIPEGTEAELAEYFNSIVGQLINGNGRTLSLLESTRIIERNLWAIGDALVQVVTALGATFSRFDLESGIQAGFSGSNSSLIGQLQRIDDSVKTNTHILEQNLWAIGDVLVQIRDALQGTPSFAVGGPVGQTGLANVHSGEYVVPRNGALVSSDPEVSALLERVDLRLRNLEKISEQGFGAVVTEERQTRNDMRRTRQTVRA